ncbi:hypothetical protein [Phenylobacterium sp.]|uniref:hypothetical protein n=1 Tax=Phenylobacterium sp. TaxID=1871053 RepID=UPI0035AE713C
MITYIDDNTFAAACYDQNSVAELERALIDGPDQYDMNEWGLSADEWTAQINLALKAKLEDQTDQ